MCPDASASQRCAPSGRVEPRSHATPHPCGSSCAHPDPSKGYSDTVAGRNPAPVGEYPIFHRVS